MAHKLSQIFQYSHSGNALCDMPKKMKATNGTENEYIKHISQNAEESIKIMSSNQSNGISACVPCIRMLSKLTTSRNRLHLLDRMCNGNQCGQLAWFQYPTANQFQTIYRLKPVLYETRHSFRTCITVMAPVAKPIDCLTVS